MADVWFIFEINRRERTVTLSRHFAGHRGPTVPWHRVRFCDGSAIDTWDKDCRPVELLNEGEN